MSQKIRSVFYSQVLTGGLVIFLAIPGLGLFHFRPWAMMRFHTAIGLILLGISLISLAYERQHITKIGGFGVTVLGLVKSLENLLSLHTGMNLPHAISANQTLGKMTPIIGVAMMTAGGSLLFLAKRKRSGQDLASSAVLGAVPTVLGFWAMLGHFAPNISIQLAVPSSTGFLVVGACLIYSSIRALSTCASESFRLVPVGIATALITCSISVWQFELERDVHYQERLILAEAEKVRSEIFETLKQTSQSLARYASRVEYLGIQDREYLRLDSQSYLEQLPILRRIGITDSKYRVIWSYPSDLSHQVLNYREDSDPIRKTALDDARDTHHPSLSSKIDLRSGKSGFLLPVALYPKGQFGGAVYATVEAEQLFHSYRGSDEFSVTIRELGQTIFERNTNLTLRAEDNQLNQIITTKILEKNGFQVDVVANGHEAVAALESFLYDIVIMDCQMPEMDGYQASQKIRASTNPKAASIPIIAMTANAMAGDREKCLAAGMTDYVTKPIKSHDLVNVVYKNLGLRASA